MAKPAAVEEAEDGGFEDEHAADFGDRLAEDSQEGHVAFAFRDQGGRGDCS